MTILLALSTMLRVSEIASIAKSSIIFSERSLTFTLAKPRKWQPSGPLAGFHLRRLEDYSTCPLECLREYIGRTEVFRHKANESSRFISATFRHLPVS